MVLKNKRKQNILQDSNVGVGEDKISNLPDALIHHILSFLPIKCGMSTCILSKRWKYLVYSIPTLDFRNWRAQVDTTKNERKLETKGFMNFMDRVLFIHEKPDIQKFYLNWDDLVDESRVNRWITSIMKRKVEEICLSIECPNTSSIFPLSFFTCDSLTLLDLSFYFPGFTKLVIPNTVYFPKLKILRLAYIKFVGGTSSKKLFSNCPILEELSLKYCSDFQSDGACIANPTLKHLYITYWFFGKSVKICAPKLSTMVCRLAKPADFVIDSFPSLVEADIDLRSGTEFSIKLLRKLSNVKLLKMSCVCSTVQNEADILLSNFPAFNNLIHLEVTSSCSCISFGSDSLSVMRRFFRFLQLSPNLESIVFAQSIRILEDEDDSCWSLDPKYSLPHLKSIKVKYFNGEPWELNAIKLFLKYLSFLETVTIVASPGLSKDDKEQINAMKLLLKFPKPAKCVVNFLTSSETA